MTILRVVRRLPLVLAGLLLWSVPAFADLVTISATAYALGTDVTHAYDGITLQRITQGSTTVYAPVYHPVITSVPTYGPVGTSFGNFATADYSYEICERLGVAPGSCHELATMQGVFEVSFREPTDFVSIVGDFGNDAPAMLVYGADRSLLTSCGPGYGSRPDCTESWFQFNPGVIGSDARSTLTVSRAQGDISRIVWGSFTGAAYPHQISYTAAEPGTLLLVGLGASGVLLRRREATPPTPPARSIRSRTFSS